MSLAATAAVSSPGNVEMEVMDEDEIMRNDNNDELEDHEDVEMGTTDQIDDEEMQIAELGEEQGMDEDIETSAGISGQDLEPEYPQESGAPVDIGDPQNMGLQYAQGEEDIVDEPVYDHGTEEAPQESVEEVASYGVEVVQGGSVGDEDQDYDQERERGHSQEPEPVPEHDQEPEPMPEPEKESEPTPEPEQEQPRAQELESEQKQGQDQVHDQYQTQPDKHESETVVETNEEEPAPIEEDQERPELEQEQRSGADTLNDNTTSEYQEHDNGEEESQNGTSLSERIALVKRIPILLTREDDSSAYYLFPTESVPEDDENVLVRDCSSVDFTIEQVFSALREVFASYGAGYNLETELIFEFPQLGLKIGEDNCYSRDLSLYDVLLIFADLSDKTPEDHRPMTLEVELSSQQRLLSVFNYLSDLVREGKGFDSLTYEISEANGNFGDGEEAGEAEGEDGVNINEDEHDNENVGDENENKVTGYEDEGDGDEANQDEEQAEEGEGPAQDQQAEVESVANEVHAEDDSSKPDQDEEPEALNNEVLGNSELDRKDQVEEVEAQESVDGSEVVYEALQPEESVDDDGETKSSEAQLGHNTNDFPELEELDQPAENNLSTSKTASPTTGNSPAVDSEFDLDVSPKKRTLDLEEQKQEYSSKKSKPDEDSGSINNS